MHGKHQPDGVDFAHLQAAGKGVWPIATALRFGFHPRPGFARNVVISVEGAADRRNRQPQFFGNGFERHDFPCPRG